MEQACPSLITAFALDFTVLTWGLSWNWRRAIRATAVLNFFAFAVLVLVISLPVAEMFFWALIAPVLALPVTVALAIATVGFALLNMALKWPLFVVLFRPARRSHAFKLLSLASLASGAILVARVWDDDQPKTIPEHEIAWLESEYAPEIAFLHARVDEMSRLGYAPWRDPDWSSRMQVEAGELRFHWLELRYSSHERFALADISHKQTDFHAQTKNDYRWVLRGEDKDQLYYRYIVIKQNGKDGSLEAIADFVTPAN
ncbi:hypothetical protein ACXYMO_09960 [Arenibacterium sp. CAU 1754]